MPRAMGSLFGAVLAMQVAVRPNLRQWRTCVPLDLGGSQRACGEDGRGWDIFSIGDDGVRGIVSC